MSLQLIIPEATKKRIGLAVIQRIRANTLRGIGADGQPFAPYSTKPFARPAGGITKKAIATLKASGEITFFKREGKSTWVVIEGGYLALKKAMRPADGDTPNLTDKGSMLRALTVVSVTGDEIVIGFTRESESEKAFWHNVAGKTLRKFLGLPDADLKEIIEEFGHDFQLTV